MNREMLSNCVRITLKLIKMNPQFKLNVQYKSLSCGKCDISQSRSNKNILLGPKSKMS